MPVPSYRMSSCSGRECQRIASAIQSMRGSHRANAEALLARMGSRDLCLALHAMRRWYSNQCAPIARRLIDARYGLASAMDLSPPVGAFRGFKVDRGSRLALMNVGDRVVIPVTRNGACSSWTACRSKANLFSGAGRGKTGIVVRLVSGAGVTCFIAPPSHSEPWFDALYSKTMGRAFRFKEQEFAICSDAVTVEIVAIKRR